MLKILNPFSKKSNQVLLVLLLSTSFLFNIQTSNAQYGAYGLSDAYTSGLAGSGLAQKSPNSYLNNMASAFDDSDSSFFHITLPNINAQAYTNTISLKDFNYYFGHPESERKYLSEVDKENLKKSFTNDGYFLANVSIIPISFKIKPSNSLGTFVFSVSDFISTNLIIPQDLVDLTLFGNEVNKDYSFKELKLQTWYTRNYSLGYAMNILSGDSSSAIKFLNVGLNAKYYQGFAHSDFQIESGSLYTASDHKIKGNYVAKANTSHVAGLLKLDPFYDGNDSTDFSPLPESKSNGFGFDISAFIAFKKGIRVAIALNDIGSITWQDNAKEYTMSQNFELTDLLDNKRIDSLLDGNNKTDKSISSFSSSLPTNLKMGVTLPLDSLGMNSGLTLMLDFAFGLNNSAFNNKNAKLSLAAEFKPSNSLPYLISGVTNDYSGKFRWSMGLGYSSSLLDVIISNYDVKSLFGDSNHTSVSFLLCWKII